MYKLNDNWIPVGRGHILPQPTTISNLIPATLYSIKVTAYNEAGKISQNFVVITRALNGGEFEILRWNTYLLTH